MRADELFDNTLEWLKENYSSFRFFVERDVVWTVQLRLLAVVAEQNLPFQIFNDYPIIPGLRRSLSADLVILDNDGAILVAVEFKYEPDHRRQDILRAKFPVVSWGADGVLKDIARIDEFVRSQKCQKAYAVLIDEGGYFHSRAPHPKSEWRAWDNGVWILRSRASL